MTLQLFEQDWRDVWDGAAPTEPIGAVFTKVEVTEFIMDLAGYDPQAKRLAASRLLEPSCGDGAFLTIAVRRLLESEQRFRSTIDWSDPDLANAIKACDVNIGFVIEARNKIAEQLVAAGCPSARAKALVEEWVEHSDFLLKVWREKFDHVIGNPPYVRIEDLPGKVLQRYRETYQTCVERADLYVAFFEQGLHLLSPDGNLAFICANRFAKNLYGRALRELIARDFRVRYYLNLEHTQPFATEVSAYPCVVVLDRQHGAITRAASLDSLEPEILSGLSSGKDSAQPTAWAHFPAWYQDGAPWVATSRQEYTRHVELARKHPAFEESAEGTRVGIGVATGADDIFILPAADPSIETECQLPLIMAGDISPQGLKWSGHFLVNPYEAQQKGGFRDLSRYPGLAKYFERHRSLLEKRHTAKKNPGTWFRTIDRVTHELTGTPKLLLPDIQSGGVVGFDEGKYYPHHNLYWITSTGWNLRALQALLRSTLVFNQVRAHSVQMRGGAVRYQAQVLRKVRVPLAAGLSVALVDRLAVVAGSGNQSEIDAVAEEAFNL